MKIFFFPPKQIYRIFRVFTTTRKSWEKNRKKKKKIHLLFSKFFFFFFQVPQTQTVSQLELNKISQELVKEMGNFYERLELDMEARKRKEKEKEKEKNFIDPECTFRPILNHDTNQKIVGNKIFFFF